jgi:DNA-binding NtrC family response regulator
MSKVLVIENTGNIQALLKQRFRGKHISVDSMCLISGAMEPITTSGYDVLIWDAVASKTEQSKGLELLDLLTKDSSKTYIIVVMDQESGSLPPDRLKAYAHRALTRPFDGDEICALVTQAIHQQASSEGTGTSQIPVPLEYVRSRAIRFDSKYGTDEFGLRGKHDCPRSAPDGLPADG